MESLLIYRKVVAWTLDSSGSMGLEDITEQQIRLVWLKKSLLYMLLGSSRKKKKVVDNCNSIYVIPICHYEIMFHITCYFRLECLQKAELFPAAALWMLKIVWFCDCQSH